MVIFTAFEQFFRVTSALLSTPLSPDVEFQANLAKTG